MTTRAPSRALADEIGGNDRQLAAAATDWSSPIRIGFKSAGGAHWPSGQPLGSPWAELGDIGADRAKLGRRAARPDYLNQDFGAGFSSWASQVSSQAQTSSLEMRRPASISAKASA